MHAMQAGDRDEVSRSVTPCREGGTTHLSATGVAPYRGEPRTASRPVGNGGGGVRKKNRRTFCRRRDGVVDRSLHCIMAGERMLNSSNYHEIQDACQERNSKFDIPIGRVVLDS